LEYQEHTEADETVGENLMNPRVREARDRDLEQRFNWLYNRCEKSDERNEDLARQLTEQARIINQLQTKIMERPDASPRTHNESQTTSIAKLNGKNFRTWQKEMEIVLKEMDSWERIQGEKKFAKTRYEREYSTRESDNIYKLIYQSCDDYHRDIIVNISDPKIAWDELEKLFKPNNAMSKLMAMRTFFSIAIKNGETMDAYIRRYLQTYHDFVAAGQHELDDSFLAQHLLLSLPEDFDYVRSITNTLKAEDLSTARVKDILISEWQQRNLTKTSQEKNHGIYFAKTKYQAAKPAVASEIRCFGCGDYGHKRNECR
jgi:hypothetical protein